MAGDAPLLGLSAAPLGLPFGGSESTGVALVLKIEEQRYKPWTITNGWYNYNNYVVYDTCNITIVNETYKTIFVSSKK